MRKVKPKQIEEDLKTKQFVVSDVAKKEMRRTPPPPYTTSTLQQDGVKKNGVVRKKNHEFGAKTLRRRIYYLPSNRFGVDGGLAAVSAMQQVMSKKTYGINYIPGKPRYFTKPNKNWRKKRMKQSDRQMSMFQSAIVSEKLGATTRQALRYYLAKSSCNANGRSGDGIDTVSW